MSVLFYLPFVFSVAGGFLFLTSEVDWKWKALAIGMIVSSVAIQFVPMFAETVHFLVPLGMQLVLRRWFSLYWRLEGI